MKIRLLLLFCTVCCFVACNSTPPVTPPTPEYSPDPTKDPVIPAAFIPAFDASEDGDGPYSLVGGTVASPDQFKNVGRIDATGMGSGVLIDPKWALTAAHVVYNQRKTPSAVKFTVAGKQYVSDLVVIPTTYRADAFSLGSDIALVRLKTVVEGVTPAKLSSVVPVVKTKETLVGYGLTGSVVTGGINGAGIKRYGNQTVDHVLAPYILSMVDGTETVAIASGDSGGPAFLFNSDVVIGVTSGASVGAGGKTGVKGTYFFHTRTDVHQVWALDTMKKNAI